MDASLDREKLRRFLERIEAGYSSQNSYHNATHAADVLQSMRALLLLGHLYPRVTDLLGVLACYLAAVVHDYEHTGRTNDFLIATQHPFALEHNQRKAPQVINE